MKITSQRFGEPQPFNDLTVSVTPINLNPYTLQNHAQQAVLSPHNAPHEYGHGNAPPLNNVSPNPSAVSAKNIVRGTYVHPRYARR